MLSNKTAIPKITSCLAFVGEALYQRVIDLEGVSAMPKVQNQLNTDLWKALLAYGDPQEFNYGDIIYKQNELSKGLYCFLQGKIRLYAAFSDGMERTIHISMTAPEILGETSVIDDGKNLCTAIALAKTRVIFISKESVQLNLLSNPNYIDIIIKGLAQKLKFMQAQAENAAFKLPQRIARLLLSYNYVPFTTCCNGNTRIIITHDELAGYLGTTRAKVTKYLNELYKLNLIEKGRGFIRITDYEGLRKYAVSGAASIKSSSDLQKCYW